MSKRCGATIMKANGHGMNFKNEKINVMNMSYMTLQHFYLASLLDQQVTNIKDEW